MPFDSRNSQDARYAKAQNVLVDDVQYVGWPATCVGPYLRRGARHPARGGRAHGALAPRVPRGARPRGRDTPHDMMSATSLIETRFEPSFLDEFNGRRTMTWRASVAIHICQALGHYVV